MGLVEPASTAAQASQLPRSDHDKVFLKHCKTVRDIRKLEEQKSSGKSLDALQEQKLKKKGAALKDVQEVLKNIPRDSVLRQRNEDVIEAAMAEVDASEPVPAVVESQVTMDEAAAEVARTPAVVKAQPAADEEWQRPSCATADENGADESRKPRGKRGGRSGDVRRWQKQTKAGRV